MSDPEKPLHVAVAEALGCTPVYSTDPEVRLKMAADGYPCACWCPGRAHAGHLTNEVLRYDLDWSATGPLIEKYRLAIQPTLATEECGGDPSAAASWDAYTKRTYQECLDQKPGVLEVGVTPLIAVCRLLLALEAAGKLEGA